MSSPCTGHLEKYGPHFTGEEMKAQKGEVAKGHTHSKWMNHAHNQIPQKGLCWLLWAHWPPSPPKTSSY